MIRRLLQIRDGESKRALLLFTYLFLVIASSVITRATRDPLFQEQFGSERLPYVDMASAVMVAAVMFLYVRIGRRAELQSVLVGTLILSAAATLMFWFVARVREPVWMLPVLYVWASVAGVLLPAQVWMLANQVMTTREAKRLFGIVSGGAISGWIVGGFVTRAIATRRGTADLLLPTAAALAACSLLVVAIWRQRVSASPSQAETDTQNSSRDDSSGIRTNFALVWQSPHLRAVAALICVSSLVTTVVGWQFKAMAKAVYPETDRLAAFYGTFNMYAGALSLMTQFFITSRLLRRFGIGVALLIVPVALTGGSVGLLLSGGLWAAVLLRGSDQVVRYSIDKATVELLYLPVPARQMTRAKALIDTAVWRTGDGLGAALVLVCLKLLGLTASQISGVVLVFLVAWIAAAIAARRHYVETLRDSIYEHRLDVERLSVDTDRATADVLADALGADNPADIVYALSLLEYRARPVTHPAVSRLLEHPAAEVRRKAVAVFSAAEDAGVLARVEPLLHDPDAGVRAEALVYLSRCGTVDPLSYLGDLDEVHGSAVASAIAHFLARPGPAQNIDAVRVLLQAATDGDDPERHRAKLEAARLIGSLPNQFEEQLNALLKDPSVDVARLAIRAAASVGSLASVPLVVARLADPNLTADAADTLVVFGNRAIPALRHALGGGGASTPVVHAIPDVLQRIATAEAEQLLVEFLLNVDPVLRLRVVSALNKLRQQNGDRRLEPGLVETVLAAEILGHYRPYQLLGRLSKSEAASVRVKETMDDELERIFRLMKLLLPQHDLHSVYFALQSGNAVVHANALEFLEHAVPARLRMLLLPLIDSEVSLEDRVALADQLFGATLESSEQALAALALSEELLREAARKAEVQLGHQAGGETT